MKKLLFILLLWLSSFVNASIQLIDKATPKNNAFQGIVDSSQVIVVSGEFNGILSSIDTDVQKALATIDSKAVMLDPTSQQSGAINVSSGTIGNLTAPNFSATDNFTVQSSTCAGEGCISETIVFHARSSDYDPTPNLHTTSSANHEYILRYSPNGKDVEIGFNSYGSGYTVPYTSSATFRFSDQAMTHAVFINGPAIVFNDDDNMTNNYLAFRASETLTDSGVFRLPADKGAAGQVWTTDGNWNIYWSTPSAGGSGSDIFVSSAGVWTTTDSISVGQLIINSTGTGAWSAHEGYWAEGAVGRDIIYADSTTHSFWFIPNNSGRYRLPGSSTTNTAGNLAIWSTNGNLVDGGPIPEGGTGSTTTWVHASGYPSLFGDVTLVPGTNVTFSQSGGSITVNASGTGSTGLTFMGVGFGDSDNVITADSTSFNWSQQTQTLNIKAGGSGFSSGFRISASTQRVNMGNAGFIKVKDGIAYITASGGNSLTTFNVMKDTNPIFLTQLTGGSLNGAEGLELDANTIYLVSMTSNSITALDNSNPGYPTIASVLVDSTNLNGAEFIALAGNKAFVLNFNSGGSLPGLTRVDISSRTNMYVDATVTSSSITAPVYGQIKWPYMFITNEDASCKLTAVNLETMQVAGALVIPGCSNGLMTSDYYENNLYIGGKLEQVIYTVNIASASNMVFVSSNDLTGTADPFTLKVLRDKLYCTGPNLYGIAEFNLADNPNFPTFVQAIQSVDAMHVPDDLYFDNGRAYITTHGGTGTEGGFAILRVGDINVPTARVGNLTADDIHVSHDIYGKRLFSDLSITTRYIKASESISTPELDINGVGDWPVVEPNAIPVDFNVVLTSVTPTVGYYAMFIDTHGAVISVPPPTGTGGGFQMNPTTATVNFSSAVYLNGSPGVAGQVMTSGGEGTIPSWSTLTAAGTSSTQTWTGENTLMGATTFYGEVWFLNKSTFTFKDANVQLDRVSVFSSSAPTLAACGTAPSIVGTDTAFTFTVGTSTGSCNVIFANAFSTVPVCTVSPRTPNVTNAVGYVVTTSSMSFTRTTFDSQVVDVHCYGRN